MKNTSNSRKKVFLSNTVAQWTRQSISVVSLIITVPIIANHFGVAVLGLILMIGQATSFFQLADSGMTAGLRVLVPKYRAKREFGSAGRVVLFTFLYLCIVGLALCVVSILVAPLIPAWGVYASPD